MRYPCPTRTPEERQQRWMEQDVTCMPACRLLRNSGTCYPCPCAGWGKQLQLMQPFVAVVVVVSSEGKLGDRKKSESVYGGEQGIPLSLSASFLSFSLFPLSLSPPFSHQVHHQVSCSRLDSHSSSLTHDSDSRKDGRWKPILDLSAPPQRVVR